MHEALQTLGFVTADEAQANASWLPWLQALGKDQRATCLTLPSRSDRRSDVSREPLPSAAERLAAHAAPASGHGIWTCAERLPQLQALFPDATLSPPIAAPEDFAEPTDRESALLELLRARLGGFGPVTVDRLAHSLPVPQEDIEIALLQLQNEGVAMQGRFTDSDPQAPV